MKTDKQLFKIFAAVPEWLFELAGLPSPGTSTLQSFTVKALERVADGVVVPEAPDQPLTVVEFQFQKDDSIYLRMVVEMAAVQEANPGRSVQGVIFFGYNNLDPRTEPWTRVVRSCVLAEVLDAWERERPRHPLVAVFKPLLAESEEALEREAVAHYRAIKYSELADACKRALEAVFVSWLEQRLKHKQKKEIEIMLLGELPDLEETQSGKDLIRIGEQRGLEKGREEGREEGLEKAILVFLAARHGAVPPAIQEKIEALTADEAERLIQHLPQCPSLDALAQWFAAKP
jgi:predicted transposase YdaD